MAARLQAASADRSHLSILTSLGQQLPLPVSRNDFQAHQEHPPFGAAVVHEVDRLPLTEV
jgi:hypothetical protein